MKLIVNEIFYSLQGEGGRTGEASVFIRLTKCNLACSFCDTDFADGDEMSVDEILEAISVYPCKWIIWTGGEPTIQLKDEHLAVFREHGYKQAIETNGTRRVPSLIDYITCSPKQDYETIKNRIPFVHEIRMPIQAGDPVPDISIFPQADNYFLSPVFDADKINAENVAYCVDLIKQHPQWRLSLQTHKLIHIE
ncbi:MULTISPECIES: radical SAM protein [unclassified Dysgonomonas]|jgi:organic radical activating enzyme|uniref:7-carboxy-7-deazaguanine synthase QueE n=1 Tax=unclassified Dysgonomonas TaxID=2630389 RepID=UPI0025C59035|nr:MULTISPECIES: radical SAM protein [unclassified Dysgonomonas]MDR2002037.1 7-carboxy-7-deazaguanine synthase QueE [Prevotella sp.]HMM02756.1 radical SAM protein [Dysgonomonas sp.]